MGAATGEKFVKTYFSRHLALIATAMILPFSALAEPPGDPAPVKQDEIGVWHDKNGDPTYKIEGGKLDFSAYSGFRRYHSECHVCHGPDGEGSTYAPALKTSLKTIGYAEFFGIVVGGRQNVANGNNNVMPAFADNKNVVCYLNDIYVYLRARSNESLERGRPQNHAAKSPEYDANETKCLAGG